MLLKTLSGDAVSDDGRSVYRELRLNPLSMTVDQLFGGFDAATSDWMDGVFPALLRRATRMNRGLLSCDTFSASLCTKVGE